MATALKIPQALLEMRRNLFFTHPLLKAASDDVVTLSGTAAVLAERAGGLSLTTAASDNNLVYAASNGTIAELTVDRPLYAGFHFRYAEANTNAANVFVGLFSTTLSTVLGDNGAGIPSNFSGVGLYKMDGGTANWTAFVSNATAQTKVELTSANSTDKTAHAAATASTVNQFVEIEIVPKTSTKANVYISIDGKVVQVFTDWVWTSLAAMYLVVACKSGSATAEVLKVKRIDFAQVNELKV